MRLPQLDAIRAIAIGLVIIEHYGGRSLNLHLPLGMGSLGVGLFFCLSGFLITSILMAEYATGLPKKEIWTNFYVRRFLRLMPPYYAWIAILVLLGIEPVASSWLWHVAYLSNVWNALGNPLLDFWSLAVEEQFYLIWPFVLALTPRRYLLPTIFLGTVGLSTLFKAGMAQAGFTGDTIQTLLLTNLCELGTGSMLAVTCFRKGKPYDLSWYTPRCHRMFTILAALALAEAVSGWYLWGTKGPFRYYINDALCAVPMAWLVLAATRGIKGLPGKFFDNRAVQYVGQISYSIYLTHNFIPDIVKAELGDLPRWQLGLISISLTLIITSLSWFYFEKPILKLKRYFITKPAKATQPAEVSLPIAA